MTDSSVAEAAYTITTETHILNVTAPSFAAQVEGYAQPQAQGITLVSSGNSSANITEVTLSGPDAACFILNRSTGAVIRSGEADNSSYI